MRFRATRCEVKDQPQQESNLHPRFRRPMLCPLSYGAWRRIIGAEELWTVKVRSSCAQELDEADEQDIGHEDEQDRHDHAAGRRPADAFGAAVSGHAEVTTGA